MSRMLRVTSIVALLTVATSLAPNTVRAADEFKPVAEKDLIAVLQSGQPAEKAIACKRLAIYGSKECCPELAKLLGDEQLASWARIALEAIPDPAADEALRKSLDSLKGRLAIGTINSIGVRRDAAAVDQLVARLKDEDAGVASAAAVALGRISNPAATAALRGELAGSPAGVRPAIAEGLILCAERFHNDKQEATAIEIYDQVRTADVPKPRRLDATRGAILARKTDGIPLLLEQLRAADKHYFQIGLTTARELPGREVAQALSEELGKSTPDRSALLLYAIADRQDTVVSPAVLAAAKSGDKQTRIAAVGLIGRSGDASSVETLLAVVGDADAEIAQAVKEALTGLPGDKVNAEITARLTSADGKMLALLIETVGQRRIDATPALVKALEQSDVTIRNAAIAALGETVALKDLGVLIAQALSPKSPEEGKIAVRALQAACVRMPDRDACATELAAALPQASAPSKVELIKVLGAVGGAKALATIAVAMKGSDDQLQDAGSKVLGQWMTADAAPVLLEQAKVSSADKYQVRALRGYIRIARQFQLPAAQRAEMCKQALDAANRPEEQALVMTVLERYPCMEALKVAIEGTKRPGLKESASFVALAIAHKLGDTPETTAMLKEANIERPTLEILKAEYGSGRKQQDVTDIVRKQIGATTTIKLAKDTFNESFGGDPVPGSPKQLKIQYRLNGKTGEATFAEDAAIILATPK